MEYKVEYFDEEFFEGRTGAKGGDRIRVPGGLGIVRGVVDVLATAFHGKTFLDVGCGVGWFVKYLQERGEAACGVELSQYAVDRAITHGVIQGDMRDLSFIATKYDVVFSWNVMAYLVKEDIPKTIESLNALSKSHVVLGIVTTEGLEQRPHGKPGRLTMKPWRWWMDKFEACGMSQDKELAEKINRHGGSDWNVFCLKKK